MVDVINTITLEKDVENNFIWVPNLTYHRMQNIVINTATVRQVGKSAFLVSRNIPLVSKQLSFKVGPLGV